MDKFKALKDLRKRLSENLCSIGGWIQIPDPNIGEIFGNSKFDWVAIDIEHGSVSTNQLPDMFRALELGDTLPFVRVFDSKPSSCKRALDAGAVGLIIPMVSSGNQIRQLAEHLTWPPTGQRGVAYQRANSYGKSFDDYKKIALCPFLVPMIENKEGVENIDQILQSEGVDAIFVGPYDLSASLGCLGKFDDPIFCDAIEHVLDRASFHKVPAGIHVVENSVEALSKKIEEGFKFIAYSMDSVILRSAIEKVGYFQHK